MNAIEQLVGLREKRADTLAGLQAGAEALAREVKQVDDVVLFLKGAQDNLVQLGFDPEISLAAGGWVRMAFVLPDVAVVSAVGPEPVADAEVVPAPSNNAAPAVDAVSTPEQAHKIGPWTDAELRIVAAAVENGKTREEIATTLKRSNNGVGMKMKALAREAAKAPIKVPDAPSAVKLPARDAKAIADRVARKKRAACAPNQPEQNLSAEDRAINTHLDTVGYKGGWSKLMDFEILSGLMKGKGAALVADELGVETGDLVGRFKAINTKAGDIPHQTRLVRILRMRAGV